MDKLKKFNIEAIDVPQQVFDEIRSMAEHSYNSVISNNINAKKLAAVTSIILASKIKVTHDVPTAAAYFETKDAMAKPIILVNPYFYEKMKGWGGKHFGLLVHEVFHCIMQHFQRFQNPKSENEKQLLNIALDCAINQLIAEFSSFAPSEAEWKMLQRAKPGEKFNCINYFTFCRLFGLKESEVEKNREAEYYYRLALDNADKLPNAGDCSDRGESGSGDMGKGEDHDAHFNLNKDATPEETEAIRQYLKKVFTLHGVKPSDFGIDELQSGVLRWKSILRNFVNRSVKTDCKKSRSRPNRRHGFSVAKRVYDRKPELVFLADSSGSMVHDFSVMANEVFSLCREAKLEKVDVYYIDTELHEKCVYRRGQPFPPVKGGGGTAFTEGLNALAKKLRQGQSVIFFTDTCTDDWPQKKPAFPLLIIATEAVYNAAPAWVRKCAIDASELLAEARKKLVA
jgi:predicted metal-dependent peptidase